jgi:molybdate transport system substrate-binding protein
MVITLFSEIVPIRGVEILGPLPGDLHYEIRFAAAVSATAKKADAAKALIGFLAGPKAMQTFKAKGLGPL